MKKKIFFGAVLLLFLLAVLLYVREPQRVYGDEVWKEHVPADIRKYAYVLGPGVVKDSVDCSRLFVSERGCVLSGSGITLPECVLLSKYCGKELPASAVLDYIDRNLPPCASVNAWSLTERVILLQWAYATGERNVLKNVCACEANAKQVDSYSAVAYLLLCDNVDAVREVCSGVHQGGGDIRREKALTELCSSLGVYSGKE